ncbi:MAG: PIN domain-containing protein [Verrucomicrobiales bacterium]
MTHLLDTTALLALMLDEAGGERVETLIDDDQVEVAISVLTKAETWARLKSLGREAAFEEEWRILLPLFGAVLEVDEGVVDASLSLRGLATSRLPSMDALIAGTAVRHQLILVHRDAHFRAIPEEELPSIDLTEFPAS